METIYVAYESCERHSSVWVCSSLDVDLVCDAGGRCVSAEERARVHRGFMIINVLLTFEVSPAP